MSVLALLGRTVPRRNRLCAERDYFVAMRTLLLFTGLFSIASGEKQTSASFDAVEQADLAVQAGLAKASAMLDEVIQGDDAVIFAKPLSPATESLHN